MSGNDNLIYMIWYIILFCEVLGVIVCIFILEKNHLFGPLEKLKMILSTDTCFITEYVSSWSKHLKAPLAVDSDGVAGLKWTGEVRYWSSHADVGRAEQPSVYICATGHAYQSPIVTADNSIAAQHRIWGVTRKRFELCRWSTGENINRRWGNSSVIP